MKFIKLKNLHYDEVCSILVDTDTAFHGRIVQDVVTKPTEKYVHIVGNKGFLKWYINYDSNNDAVKYYINDKEHLKLFPKTRPDDFKNEIDEKLLYTIINMGFQDNKYLIISSPISLKNYKVKLKDLSSRFTSFVEIGIDLPTDDLLRVILTKNFSDKQIEITKKILNLY